MQVDMLYLFNDNLSRTGYISLSVNVLRFMKPLWQLDWKLNNIFLTCAFTLIIVYLYLYSHMRRVLPELIIMSGSTNHHHWKYNLSYILFYNKSRIFKFWDITIASLYFYETDRLVIKSFCSMMVNSNWYINYHQSLSVNRTCNFMT